MTEPKTLLEMAGAPQTPPAVTEATLVLIDCQREYVDGSLPLPGISQALAEAGRLLALARVGGAPVIHVVHRGRPGGGLFDPEGPGGEIAREVAPREDEAIVAKSLPNAFAGTDLDGRLKALGRRELIVGGFMTHMCVSSTVRAALDLGYRCTVVAGATATRDLPDGHGGIVEAATLQRAELSALADRFAVVVDGVDAWAG